MMDPLHEHLVRQTRRHFFGQQGLRLGSLSLAAMAANPLARYADAAEAESNPATLQRVHPPLPGLPHFAPKAKAIIYVHFNGGPPQHDTWD